MIKYLFSMMDTRELRRMVQEMIDEDFAERSFEDEPPPEPMKPVECVRSLIETLADDVKKATDEEIVEALRSHSARWE